MKPKNETLKLFGYNWKIKKGFGDAGGSFDWVKKTMLINDKYGDYETILLHEIIEAILLENLTRYYGQEGNTEYHFFFNHTQFTKIIKDIYQALKDNKII